MTTYPAYPPAGPWRRDPWRWERLDTGAKRGRLALLDRGSNIILVVDPDEEPKVADAALIALAPELADALRALLDVADVMADRLNDLTGADWRPDVDATGARALLARLPKPAEGGEG